MIALPRPQPPAAPPLRPADCDAIRGTAGTADELAHGGRCIGHFGHGASALPCHEAMGDDPCWRTLAP